ncbi:hypothetical protein RM531_08515 [Salinisphaera sp. P385]|uniref:Sel1 repeat-containing protein n=1 Tax=Spectribacter acetivorans TaxID=3075603 RepID=A0ABU3B7T9_9GAMM|nr:hypothetical protein [Salinisphaera sp. P385]MDT0618519.1 hypothetical protein [Salinisphaera sp. P385]
MTESEDKASGNSKLKTYAMAGLAAVGIGVWMFSGDDDVTELMPESLMEEGFGETTESTVLEEPLIGDEGEGEPVGEDELPDTLFAVEQEPGGVDPTVMDDPMGEGAAGQMENMDEGRPIGRLLAPSESFLETAERDDESGVGGVAVTEPDILADDDIEMSGGIGGLVGPAEAQNEMEEDAGVAAQEWTERSRDSSTIRQRLTPEVRRKFDRLSALHRAGDAEASYELGVFLRDEVPDAGRQAFNTMLLAAQGGSVDAMMAVGDAYRLGLNTTLEPIMSYAWYTIAQAFGAEAAKAEREKMVGQLSQAQFASGQAMAREMIEQMSEQAISIAKAYQG